MKTGFVWTLFILLLLGCERPTPPASSASPQAQVGSPRPTMPQLQMATEQMVYVPAYALINVFNRKRAVPLAVTLSVHNTDLEHAITLGSVRYYDTNGTLLKEFLEAPVTLQPLATNNIVVEQRNIVGGIGANFIVTWGADQAVSEPIIEAVMVSSGTQGISFISPGRVISKPFAPDSL